MEVFISYAHLVDKAELGMKLDITLRIVDDSGGESAACKLDALLSLMNRLITMEAKMAGELDQLVADVKAQRTVVDSTVVAIKGLVEKLDAAIATAGNPQALTDLSTEIKAQTQALADAVVTPPVIGP